MQFIKRGILSVTLSALTLFGVVSCDDNDDGGPIVVGEATLVGNITSDRTLHSDTVYTLRGFVKVGSGATIFIEAGTKIVGDLTSPGSSLWILRGARIVANGTAAAPIVFTSSREPEDRKPGDFGGLIIVGNATVNRTGNVIVESSNAPLEGGGPPGVIYSEGTTDADNSGTLRYIRVEFAGYGFQNDAELNSFTFAAVGSGTTIEYLQAMAGLDDSFEWFGGTVNGRYLVSYEAGDDHFDSAEGYRGRNQFLIAYQTRRLVPLAGTGSPSGDPQGFEIDGCNGPGCTGGFDAAPFNMPVFANFTLVGPGNPAVMPNATSALFLRRGTGGVWVNGIVARWEVGLADRDPNTETRRAADSLNVRNVLFVQNDATLDPSNVTPAASWAGNAIDSLPPATTAQSIFTALPPVGTEPTVATLDWSLSPTSPARTGGLATFTARIAARVLGSFVTATVYRGAADPAGAKWWEGWTVYDIGDPD